MKFINKNNDISSSLFSKGRRRVLAALFTRPDQPRYMREIIAVAGVGQGQVQRELAQLHRAGLVLREKRANLVYYRPNPDAPIYEELKSIAFKTFGVADALRDALQPLAKKICVAFIYGSVARGEETAHSDIDVMIIGGVKFSEATLAFAAVQTQLRREINPSVYTMAELQARMREAGGFAQRVLGGGKVFLMGNEDDLGKLAGHRQTQTA